MPPVFPKTAILLDGAHTASRLISGGLAASVTLCRSLWPPELQAIQTLSNQGLTFTASQKPPFCMSEKHADGRRSALTCLWRLESVSTP